MLARAVIDASGTWTQPNPIGVDGLAVPGEALSSDRIAYGIPDVVGALRGDYAGKRILVVGGGHSAINVALALMELQDEAPATEIFWALRRNSIDKLLGGGLNDQLPERGALGLAAKACDGQWPSEDARALRRRASRERRATACACRRRLAGKPFDLVVDRIVVTTGFRPDFSFLRELRIELDPAVEAPPALSPLIDPNFHSCGTVPPHGIAELAHPEPGFTIVGSKSYGRAPTFLMATGYEQVRSVVADDRGRPRGGARGPAGAAGNRRLQCRSHHWTCRRSSCRRLLRRPAPASVDACCVADAKAKAEGKAGCGCGSAASAKAKPMEAAE